MIPTSNMQRESPAFARKANSYDTHASVQMDAAAWLAEWLPQAAAQKSCLELGAGTGLFSQYLADRFPKLECTDISAEMLLHCRERLPSTNTRVLDAWETPDWNEVRTDFLASCSLLQWAPCPVTVLRNWSDRLESNGRMLLGFFIEPSLPELDQVLNGASPVQWRSAETWQEAMAEAGLQIVRMESTTHRYFYKSALEFWKTLHGTGCNVSRGYSTGTLRRLLREYETTFKTEAGVQATWTFCRAELRVQ